MSEQDFKPTYDSAIAFLRQRDIDQEPVKVVEAEVADLRARLAVFEAREPLVRRLAGAIEDTLGDECPEWRSLVSWEMDFGCPLPKVQPSAAPPTAEPSAADGGDEADLLDDVPDHERVLIAAGYPKAASKIERLSAEVRRLRVERNAWKERSLAVTTERNQLRAELAEAREVGACVRDERDGARLERDLARDQLSALLATLRVAVKDAETRGRVEL